jgi:hypothetical protein
MWLRYASQCGQRRNIQLTSCSTFIPTTEIGTGASPSSISENSSTFMSTAWIPLRGNDEHASLCEPGTSFCESKESYKTIVLLSVIAKMLLHTTRQTFNAITILHSIKLITTMFYRLSSLQLSVSLPSINTTQQSPWSLSWAKQFQSTPSHIISIRSILIVSCHPCIHLPASIQTFVRMSCPQIHVVWLAPDIFLELIMLIIQKAPNPHNVNHSHRTQKR